MDIRTYFKNGIRFSYYYCAAMARQGKSKCNTTYVRIEDVEEAFMDQLRSIRFNPSGLKLHASAGNNMLQTSASIKAELRQIGNSIDNLTATLMNAMDSTASSYIIAKIEELDRNKKLLESNLRQATLQENTNKSLQETEKEIYNDICYLLDNFDSIEYSAKNELIRKIVKKCIFDGKNLRIVF